MTEALVKTSLCLATRSSSKYLRIVAVEAPWFAVERRGGAVVRRAGENRRLDPFGPGRAKKLDLDARF